MQKKKEMSGFTLVELLLVIAIIGILAAVLFVGLGNQRERARVTTFKENVRGLVTTYTACADSKVADGTSAEIGTGVADGESVPVCEVGNSAGIPQTSFIPAILNCNGDGFIDIAGVTTVGDNWNFTASCTRSGDGSCEADCNSDGCKFDGECE